MAVSAADLNQIRVSTLGTSVDQATTWTPAPPAAANTLAGTERVINRVINNLNIGLSNALSGTSGFAGRFDAVVGNEVAVDQAAFDSIGMNLIQAVAALVAGGGIVPSPISLEFSFDHAFDTGDYVEITVDTDCTIPADFDGAQYSGAPHPDEIRFELTAEPAGDVIGTIVIDGTNVTWSAIGGEVTAGTVLRMTAANVIGGPVAPNVVITIAAERKAAPPTAVGRFEFAQSSPAATWSIQHMLGQRAVSVQVIDDSGMTVLADVDFETANRCVLTFARPKSGMAVIRA